MKDELSPKEWKRLREILFTLFDLTWKYSELSAKNVSSSFEDTRPKRLENEPFRNYNERLLNWDKLKIESFTTKFNESKIESFGFVSELEELLTKLGMPGRTD